MARSLKKGPYVFARLLNKVKELNKMVKKKSLKHGHAVLQFILTLSDTLLQYTMGKNLFLYM